MITVYVYVEAMDLRLYYISSYNIHTLCDCGYLYGVCKIMSIYTDILFIFCLSLLCALIKKERKKKIQEEQM